jgi:hypothetical protein
MNEARGRRQLILPPSLLFHHFQQTSCDLLRGANSQFLARDLGEVILANIKQPLVCRLCEINYKTKCEISGPHGDEYEVWSLLGCTAHPSAIGPLPRPSSAISLNRLLTFHVPNLISFFRCFRRARESVRFRDPCTNFATNITFYDGELLAPRPSQAEGPPPVGCPRLLIQYICNYPPYLEAVSSIRNPRTRHAVVTVDPLNMDINYI